MEKKAAQQWNFCVAKDNVLNQVRVYRERVYADKILRKNWFVRSFETQHYPKFIAKITSENVSELRTKNAKPGPSIAM